MGCVPNVVVVGVLGVALVLCCLVVNINGRCCPIGHVAFSYSYIAVACGTAFSSHFEGDDCVGLV